MATNPQVLELLEELLESGKTPEEVCRDFPELLPEVRQRWRQFQLIDGQVRSLLPGLATRPDAGATAPPGGAPTPPAAFGRYQVRGALVQVQATFFRLAGCFLGGSVCRRRSCRSQP